MNDKPKPLREGVATGTEGQEIRIFLFENDEERAVIYVRTMAEANNIMDRWREGTYKLLMG